MLRAFFKLSAYLTFTVLCIPVQVLLYKIGSKRVETFPVWYHRRCLKIFGLKVDVVGAPALARPVLYVSNHASYLDIPVLSSILPLCFVAKAEVANWPLFGTLARLQRSLFVDRRTSKVKTGQSDLLQRLKAGDAIVLFPEGTSSDGVRVLPFKPALFQPILDEAAGLALTVQPVSIVCTGINNLSADRAAKQFYAWFGDMDLLPHLWAFCHLQSCVVRVTFHKPLDISTQTDRKTLAHSTEKLVASGMIV